jgi:hypothetical protein
MSMSFHIKKNKIKFNNWEIIEFDLPIKKDKIIIIDFVVIILLEVPPKSKYNDNVVAISDQGNFLWQVNIEEPYIKNNDCPFVDIKINNSGQLVLFNWCNAAFIVDPITGKFIDRFETH